MHPINFKDPFNLLTIKKNEPGQAPGSINYLGSHSDVGVTIEIIAYDKDSFSRYFIDSIEGLDLKTGNYWINITGLHDVTIINEIGNLLEIHMMDLEDIVHVSQRSKIEIKDNYLFSIFKMLYVVNQKIHHEHVSIILKENILLTFQEVQGDVFDGVRNRMTSPLSNTRKRGPEYLYYALIDALVDHYFPVMQKSYETFSDVEMHALETKETDTTKLYQLRKELIYMINAVVPIKDAIYTFTQEPNPYYKKTDHPYYSDLIDHLNQLSDSLKNYREMITSLYDMQMAEKSNQLNNTMMTLTMFSVIFIPLSFLAGVFGMNFTHFPGMDYPYALQIFSLSCILLATAMLFYFKKR